MKKFDKKQKFAQNILVKYFKKSKYWGLTLENRQIALKNGKNNNVETDGNGTGVFSPIKGIFSGLLVGLANGLFGGGGGMLAVPLLQKSGYSEKSAHATAILVILPICLSSFLLYFFRGFYDFSVFIPTALGVTVGGVLGAKLLKILPEKIVRIVFAGLQLIAGLYLFL